MKKCPLLAKKCIESECKFWIHLLGKNPQSEVTVDSFDCAIAFLPILLVENAQMTRQATASIDKTANQVAGLKGEVNAGNQIMLEASQRRLLDADIKKSKNGEEVSDHDF